METVNPLSELLFNKRKEGPRVVESLALEHTALDTQDPFCPWTGVQRGVSGEGSVPQDGASTSVFQETEGSSSLCLQI